MTAVWVISPPAFGFGLAFILRRWQAKDADRVTLVR